MPKITDYKSDVEYNDKVKDVFKLVTYGHSKPKITGSHAMRFKYASDYDMFTVVQTEVSLDELKLQVRNEFKEMMLKFKSTPDVYFIEFMCGVDKDGKALKWTMDEVIQGHKDEYKFIDVLDKQSVIKVEIVAYIDGQFIPFSDVFEFRIGKKGINQEKTTLDTVPSLAREVKKYYEAKNFMKVLKRLFVISLTEKNKKLSEKLINIFQSDIGFIYKIKSDLETIKEVLEKYDDKLTLTRAKDSIQALKERLATQTAHTFKDSIYKMFDNASKKNTSLSINRIIDKITENIINVVNNLLKKQIKKQRINFKKYLN
jgi:hypothetical protein